MVLPGRACLSGAVLVSARTVTLVAMLSAVVVLAAGAALLALAYGGVLPAVGSGLVVAAAGTLWLLVDDGEAS